MNIFSSLQKDATSNGSTSIFKEDNPMGYFTKSEFKNTLELFSSDGTQQKFRNCIDCFNVMKIGVSFTRTPNDTHQNGESGTWLSFQVGKVKRNLFLPHFGEMQRLIHDYASGKLKIDKTLEEYYQEASKI